MVNHGAVVLAGGRSTRMGVPKAGLEWHGSTLLRRTVGIVARATGGPVVVVRARGQELPRLPGDVLTVEDPRDGRGPVQGIAAGLAALAGRADAAFVAATDLPFLHPAFVERVLGALGGTGEGPDVALPVARGYRQPLAAAYRAALAPLAERLVAAGRARPAFLFEECSVVTLDEAALLAGHALAVADPELDSLLNVNTRQDYQAARLRPAPEVTVVGPAGAVAGGAPVARSARVRAATVAAAADAAGLPAGCAATAVINGNWPAADPQEPLAAGDTVLIRALAGPR